MFQDGPLQQERLARGPGATRDGDEMMMVIAGFMLGVICGTVLVGFMVGRSRGVEEGVSLTTY